jgi:hypothetical protein
MNLPGTNALSQTLLIAAVCHWGEDWRKQFVSTSAEFALTLSSVRLGGRMPLTVNPGLLPIVCGDNIALDLKSIIFGDWTAEAAWTGLCMGSELLRCDRHANRVSPWRDLRVWRSHLSRRMRRGGGAVISTARPTLGPSKLRPHQHVPRQRARLGRHSARVMVDAAQGHCYGLRNDCSVAKRRDSRRGRT